LEPKRRSSNIAFSNSEAIVSFDLLLPKMAEKWREVPGGSDHHPRQFSDQLLQGSEPELSAAWSRQYEEASGLRGWYWKLYGENFRGKRVLEIGSGMGFDAVYLASQGAAMTCCDIAPDNLEIVRRVARARGLDIETLHIDGIGAFDQLPRDFDAVWVIGSIHHMPFEEAREESAAILEHLKPGGRWIELTYPRERWVREGSPPFDRWGQLTDGERTPWAEWYDVEKLKLRLCPWRIQPTLEHRFGSDTYIWMDCQVIGRGETPLTARSKVAVPDETLIAAGPIWHYAWRTPLGPSPADVAVTIEIECVVEKGSVGFVLFLERENRFISREVILEARTGSQRLCLSTTAYESDTQLLTRSATALGTSEYRMTSIELRQAL
jgi:SAM-dependent methyltransferase